MNYEQFERDFCEILSKMGFWALKIPRNGSGAQPFDVLAVGDKLVNAYDCKVCKKNRFPLDRVEDNQWLAFDSIEAKTKHHALAYLAILHDGNIYRVSNFELKMLERDGEKSINLESMTPWLGKEWLKLVFGKELI